MRRATGFIAEKTAWVKFQSTLSMRRATKPTTGTPKDPALFQSTLSMRRATEGCGLYIIQDRISIHALHEESDGGGFTCLVTFHYFNPRSP